MNVNWHGVFPAVTTQFRDDQSLDIAGDARATSTRMIDGRHPRRRHARHRRREHRARVRREARGRPRDASTHVRGRVPVLTGVAEYTTALACRYARDAEKLGVDGLMVLPGDGLQVRPARDHHALPHRRAGHRPADHGLQQPGVVRRGRHARDVRRAGRRAERSSPSRSRPRTCAAITDLDQPRAATATSSSPASTTWCSRACCWARGLGLGPGQRLPGREPRCSGTSPPPGRWDEARELYRWYTPLLHLDTHVKLVQYIKLAVPECGLGSETVRAPRLPLVGAERERDPRRSSAAAIATRPKRERAARPSIR